MIEYGLLKSVLILANIRYHFFLWSVIGQTVFAQFMEENKQINLCTQGLVSEVRILPNCERMEAFVREERHIKY